MSGRHMISACHKPSKATLSRLIALSHGVHPPGRPCASQQFHQFPAVVLGAFRHHLDAAVGEVARPALDTEFQRPGTGPPAEPHTLHPAPHHRHEPHRGITRSRHSGSVPSGPTTAAAYRKVTMRSYARSHRDATPGRVA